MDRIVEVLLEKESLSGDEFRAILSQYATMPQARGGGLSAALLSFGFYRLYWLLLAVPVPLARTPLPCLLLVGPVHRRLPACLPVAARRARRLTLCLPSSPPSPRSSSRPQENLDAVARQKQPDAELSLA